MIDRNASGETRSGGQIISARGIAKTVAAAIAIALASLALAGCATGGAGEVGYVAPPKAMSPATAGSALPAKDAASEKVGVWRGETLASCVNAAPERCNAQQIVTLTLFEGAKGLTGFYRCAYGNRNCYNMNETGNIVRATLNGTRLTARVAMPDGTSCLYTGRTKGNDIKGGYSCYAGGSVIESGTWQGRREY